jgi:hypothetical protein
MYEETEMRDAAGTTGTVKTARLMRAFNEGEARERNALSVTRPGFKLTEGDVVTVVDTFGNGEAFLVEFNKNGKAKKDSCDWMGVLSAGEIEVIATRAGKG